ncbi:MAG: hypothetical protein E7575_07090 [Ruminococcaceae bacterium]|nr:hypothetical protein [Oscillospiraceae bacterium]
MNTGTNCRAFFVKGFAMILALVLSVGTFAFHVGAAEEGTGYISKDTVLCQSRKSSTADIDRIKNVIVEGIIAYAEKIDISAYRIDVSLENVYALYDFFFYDLPEAFHLSSFYYNYSGSGYLTSIIPVYDYTKDEYMEMKGKLDAAEKELLSDILAEDDLTDVQKALLLHDRIIVNCEYDMSFSKPNRYNMYGALVDGVAVCQGYANAYMYLLKKVGIRSELCISEKLNHTWNIVYIDGVAYHVDVTWDDPAYDVTGQVFHMNFLLSTDELRADKKDYADRVHDGHDAKDFDTTPKSERYSNHFWQDSEAEFQFVDGHIYYINSKIEKIREWDVDRDRDCDHDNDGNVCSVKDTWKANGGVWNGNFSRLSSDRDGVLFYSLSEDVHSYNLESGEDNIVYTPEKEENQSLCIYGFTYRDQAFVCEMNSSPNFDENTKNEHTLTLPYEKEEPALIGDVNGDGKVNSIDANIFARYISMGAPEVVFANSDINGDGKADSKDMNMLKRLISGIL